MNMIRVSQHCIPVMASLEVRSRARRAVFVLSLVNAVTLCIFRRRATSFFNHSDMATRAKTRRPVVAPEKRAEAGKKATAVSEGDITKRLASTLTISKAKGARNGAATEHSGAQKPTQDKRVSAMRAVNAASQGLTSVMKTGWKAPRAEPSAQKSTAARHEAFGLAASARMALADLRVLSPGDVDVERAAISVAGKLLSLDMVSC